MRRHRAASRARLERLENAGAPAHGGSAVPRAGGAGGDARRTRGGRRRPLRGGWRAHAAGDPRRDRRHWSTAAPAPGRGTVARSAAAHHDVRLHQVELGYGYKASAAHAPVHGVVRQYLVEPARASNPGIPVASPPARPGGRGSPEPTRCRALPPFPLVYAGSAMEDVFRRRRLPLPLGRRSRPRSPHRDRIVDRLAAAAAAAAGSTGARSDCDACAELSSGPARAARARTGELLAAWLAIPPWVRATPRRTRWRAQRSRTSSARGGRRWTAGSTATTGRRRRADLRRRLLDVVRAPGRPMHALPLLRWSGSARRRPVRASFGTPSEAWGYDRLARRARAAGTGGLV